MQTVINKLLEEYFEHRYQPSLRAVIGETLRKKSHCWGKLRKLYSSKVKMVVEDDTWYFPTDPADNFPIFTNYVTMDNECIILDVILLILIKLVHTIQIHKFPHEKCFENLLFEMQDPARQVDGDLSWSDISELLYGLLVGKPLNPPAIHAQNFITCNLSLLPVIKLNY